jgi:hypothetical protein
MRRRGSGSFSNALLNVCGTPRRAVLGLASTLTATLGPRPRRNENVLAFVEEVFGRLEADGGDNSLREMINLTIANGG